MFFHLSINITYCFIFIFLSTNTFAQQVKNSKPSLGYITAHDFSLQRSFKYTEPWDIELDSLGYVYFAHNQVSKFNGDKMIQLPVSRNEVAAQYEILRRDGKGRIWIIDKGLSFIEKDTVHRYVFNDSLASFFNYPFENLHVDDFDTLYYAPRGNGYIKISPNGLKETFRSYPKGIHGFVVTRLADGTMFHFSIMERENTIEKIPISVYYLNKDNRMLKVLTTTSVEVKFRLSLIEDEQGNWMLSMGNEHIIQAQKDSLIRHKVFSNSVMELFQDSKKDIWIGTVKQGLYRAPKGNLNQLEHVIEKGAVAVTNEDVNGGLWIKSSEDQFAYLPNSAALRYSKEGGQLGSNKVLQLCTDQERIFARVNGKEVLVIEEDSIYQLNPPALNWTADNRKSIQYPTRLYYDTLNQQLCVGYWYQLSLWHNKQWTTISFKENNLRGYKICQMKSMSDGTLLCLTPHELFKVKNRRVAEVFPFHEIKGKNKLLTVFSSNSVFTAGGKGICEWNGEQFVRPNFKGEYAKVIDEDIIAMVKCNNKLWFQTYKKGLFVVVNDTVKPVYDSKHEQLKPTSLYVSPNEQLWVTPNKESNCVFSLQLKSDSVLLSSYSLSSFATKGAQAPGSLVVLEDELFIAGDYGIFNIPKGELNRKQVAPKANVTAVFIYHMLQPQQLRYDLSYSENSIALNFEAINYHIQDAELRCRLIGLETAWTSPQYNSMQYTNLEPGTYTFQVQARIFEEDWGPVKEVTFNIATPFWQTWWFRISAGSAILIFIIFLFDLRAKQIKEVEQEKSKVAVEMARLELKAIKAQLNPHFIFNSITSVMYYLSNNKVEQVERYLQNFSKLIRTVLEHSDQALIPLRDELNLLKHYVYLESERFQGEEVQFVLEFKGIDLDDIKIPPSLFQPYIENAIWHGLQYKKGEKRILIKGEKAADLLKITIEDNGIGREEAKRKNASRKAQRSYGMMIASRRIEAFNLEEIKSVEIQDLRSDKGEAKGTRVVLYIPVMC